MSGLKTSGNSVGLNQRSATVYFKKADNRTQSKVVLYLVVSQIIEVNKALALQVLGFESVSIYTDNMKRVNN